MIQYRCLELGEVGSIADVDRSEGIDGQYRVVDAALVLDRAEIDAPKWSAAEIDEYASRLTEVLRTGGRAVGAWNGDRLVGFASLDTHGVGGDASLLLLDMLYVDRTHRGRGIGRALTRRIADAARDLGAEALYISATPTRTTVDAYVRMGATLIAAPDPALFRREPEDVHLRLEVN